MRGCAAVLLFFFSPESDHVVVARVSMSLSQLTAFSTLAVNGGKPAAPAGWWQSTILEFLICLLTLCFQCVPKHSHGAHHHRLTTVAGCS